VQRALRVVALASHRQGPSGQPLFQPLEFSMGLAREALMAAEPLGLGLEQPQAQALLAYLIDLRLLQRPGAAADRLRFPLDPLADHLAAAEQLEQLEEQARVQGPAVWEAFAAALEPRPQVERERMRDFLLALRDGVMAAQPRRALLMPPGIPDRLAQLGYLDPDDERYRLALQRARKWMWELGVPLASERRDGIAKLAAMAAAAAPDSDRRAARDVASRRLARLLTEVAAEGEEEQQEAAVALGLMATPEAVQALEQVAADGAQPPPLRRAAMEALGLAARTAPGDAIRRFLEQQLQADALDLLVEDEAGWAEHDRRLPPLQGASRALQLLGCGRGVAVPMLSLTAIRKGEGLRIQTMVVTPEVWCLPLPAGEVLELAVVPAGEQAIGSPTSEDGRNWYANQREGCAGVNVEAERTVKLQRFAMARHPITQAQWRAVAQLPAVGRDLNPSPGSHEARGLWELHAQPGALPVDSVSWHDCQEWLQRLNQWLAAEWPALRGEGQAPRLALPGEGQWEAACRAGAATPFHFGDGLDATWANFDGGYVYGPGRKGVFRQRPVPVGFYGLVNGWGLADLHGQMFEWCGDQWHPDPMGDGWPVAGEPWDGVDPALEARSTAQKDWKLLRGGSWFDEPHYCRAAFRDGTLPARVNASCGVRPCCFLPPGSLLGP